MRLDLNGLADASREALMSEWRAVVGRPPPNTTTTRAKQQQQRVERRYHHTDYTRTAHTWMRARRAKSVWRAALLAPPASWVSSILRSASAATDASRASSTTSTSPNRCFSTHLDDAKKTHQNDPVNNQQNLKHVPPIDGIISRES